MSPAGRRNRQNATRPLGSLSQPLPESTRVLCLECTRMPSAHHHGKVAWPPGRAGDLGKRKRTLRESGCVSENFIWACASDRYDGYPADGTLQLAYMIHESNHPHSIRPLLSRHVPAYVYSRRPACLQIPAGADLLSSRPGNGNMSNGAATPTPPGHSTAQAAHRGVPTTKSLVPIHLKQFIRLPTWMVTPSCSRAYHTRSPLKKSNLPTTAIAVR
ncbi:hypothetical protein GGP41_001856 [Bipolaris sorokiniana]|uniref:Uncharacterized protein n=1 Tax=Cochliobolus sativus TaxID=45130 RepID=A0A8H6DZ16_COCSA|nr:hypothetical protein GGP41_001856 [Bipolaris sorokiniana]